MFPVTTRTQTSNTDKSKIAEWVQFLYLASSYRNDAWQSDYQLEEEMKKFVKQGIKRKEILDFSRRDFPQYAWSVPTLDRRLRHFNVNYIDENVSADEVRDAVATELRGPGKLLGYRAMHKKLGKNMA